MTLSRAWLSHAALAVALSGCGTVGGWFEDDERILPGERIAVSRVSDATALPLAESAGAIVLPAPVSNSEWPQFNGNAARNIGHVAGPASFTEIWRRDIGTGASSSTAIVSPPVVAAGKVFALDAGATVSAVDASSGAPVWSVDLTPDGENSADGFGGGVAVDGDTLYVTSGFGLLHALSAASGEIRWTSSLTAPSRAAPVVVGGRVIAITRDNQIIAFEGATGARVWAEQGLSGTAGVLGGAAPAATREVVIAPFSSGELNAYLAATGRLLWFDDLTGAGRSTGLAVLNDVAGDPVIADGAVYAASQSGRFISVDLRSGDRNWTRDIGGTQPALVAGDTLFMVTREGALVAMQTATGAALWTTELGAYEDPDDREDPIVWAGPILAGGNLLLTSSDERLVVVDGKTGTILREVDLPTSTTVAPVAANGTIYILTDGADLIAYR